MSIYDCFIVIFIINVVDFCSYLFLFAVFFCGLILCSAL